MSLLLTERGVTIRTGASDPGSGTVVWATPRVASSVLSDAVDDSRVREIGTRFRGGRMYEATQSGFWTAAQISSKPPPSSPMPSAR